MVERLKLKLKKQSKPGNYRGYAPKYDQKFVAIAKVLCSRGATDADLADAFGVTTPAINNWKSMYPDFGAAVREGKAEIFDPKVERALAERALGYTVDTEEVKVLKDGEIIRIPVRKHFPPDTTACIFWLKNRQPKKWRDVYDHIHEDKNAQLTAAQLLDEIKKEVVELGLVPETVLPKGVVAAGANGKSGNGSTKH